MAKFKKIFLVSFFSAFSIAFILISLHRYNSGELFYYDFGIFGHIIWQLSRFQIPYINHLVLGNVMFLGDHFNPSLVLIAPLFWITSDLRILLIEQAIATVIAAALIYKIGKKMNLTSLIAFATSVAYLLFAGVQNPLVTDWHPESTAAVFLLAFVYSLIAKQKRIYTILFLVIFLGFKESNAATALFVFFWLFIIFRDKRKEIAIYTVSSIIYFLIITRLVMPEIAQHEYMYTPSPPSNPIQLVQNYTNSPQKQTLIYQSFISFGFVPILSGAALLMPLAELGIRLAPNGTIFNNISLGQHYNVLLGVLLSLATLQSFIYIHRYSKDKKYITYIATAVLVLGSLYTTRKITQTPINLVINPLFYSQLAPNKKIQEIQQKVPRTGTVMSHNNILPYLINRTDKVYMLKDTFEPDKPDIIVIDLQTDANPNNYYGSGREIAEAVITKLKTSDTYTKLETQDQSLYIYRRK